MLNVDIKYLKTLEEATLAKNDSLLLMGKPKDLQKVQLDVLANALQQLNVTPEWLQESIRYVSAADSNSDSNGSSAAWLNKLVVHKIDEKYSRHNTPSRAHAVTKILKSNSFGKNQLVIVACEKKHSLAYAAAIARTFPLYSVKTDAKNERNVLVTFLHTDSEDKSYSLSVDEINCFTAVTKSVRLTAKIVDMPCADMHTDIFLQEIKAVGKELGIEPVVIEGEELNKRGFGGIYHVGKAAVNSPKLVVLSNIVPDSKRTIAWVGKGIVFDTGGLNLKPRVGMCTMKVDCGGAAGILGAFYTAVKLGFRDNLHAVFCLAENAIGPTALRPDDVITMYSGKTVEINNTDAEGRLVLGDGVAYAKKDLKADIIVDMATLTGAQGIATGKYHAGLLSNSRMWEEVFLKSGRRSGDLCFPFVFTPELHFSEFKSEVADMRNSVSSANNASSACAGLFIHSHLGSDFDGIFAHLDIASPVTEGDRGTGYGVNLLNTAFGESSLNSVMQTLGKTDKALPLKFAAEENDD